MNYRTQEDVREWARYFEGNLLDFVALFENERRSPQAMARIRFDRMIARIQSEPDLAAKAVIFEEYIAGEPDAHFRAAAEHWLGPRPHQAASLIAVVPVQKLHHGEVKKRFDVAPLSPARWADFEAVFRSRGCSVARGCWCMYYRRSGEPAARPKGVTRAEANRREMKALVDGGEATGLIGYLEGAPVGWISLGPRERYAKLERSPVMKPVDAKPVWSVICFVVPAAHRRQGVARALLDGAIGYARKRRVRTLEAYPVDRRGPIRDDSLWFGTRRMFEDAGFEVVARRKPGRPVMRKTLRSSR